MVLLIDIGNTRIKWARLEQGGLQPQAAAPHAQWSTPQFLETVVHSGARCDRVLVSNVSGPRMADIVRSAVAQAWQVEPEFVASSATAGGVRNAYPLPQQLGVDRWLAIIGAHALERGALCVVSVGTALTIDGVTAEGHHLGGVIVPGPDLMQSSLLRNTSDLAQRAQHGSASDAFFADNTLGAIQQGAEHAIAAVIERAAGVMRHSIGEMPSVLMTGGASARIEKWVGLPHRVVPDLVLRGLAELAMPSR